MILHQQTGQYSIERFNQGTNGAWESGHMLDMVAYKKRAGVSKCRQSSLLTFVRIFVPLVVVVFGRAHDRVCPVRIKSINVLLTNTCSSFRP